VIDFDEMVLRRRPSTVSSPCSVFWGLWESVWFPQRRNYFSLD